MNDQTIEQEIRAKGLTAPRITPADIEANITSEHYFTGAEGIFGAECVRKIRGEPVAEEFSPPALGLLTFCVLVLRNGFTVTGESACASPENFDTEIGRKVARQNAVSKIWPSWDMNSRAGSPRNEYHCERGFDVRGLSASCERSQ